LKLHQKKSNHLKSFYQFSKESYETTIVFFEEKNEMEFVCLTQRGRLKGNRTISLANLGSNQEVPTSRKRGYKTTTLPQDFW
jgi:hypothetical protein